MKLATLFLAALPALIGCHAPASAANQLVIPTPVTAWRVITDKDKMTDKITKTAVIESTDGESLVISRNPDETVSLTFSIVEHTVRRINDDIPPVFRIDNYPAHDTSLMKRLAASAPAPSVPAQSVPAYAWHPTSVTCRIWDGKAEAGVSDEIRELMHGKSLTYQYHDTAAGEQNVTFTLRGAKTALTKVLGLAEVAEPEPVVSSTAAAASSPVAAK